MAVERVVVEADGGARGNPGPAGYGAVVVDPDSGIVLAERAESLGTATNNVAEYSGLIAGLEAAAELGARVVDVRMDSKLVVEQMSGRWKIKHPGLRPLATRAAELIRGFERVDLSWIPRARNLKADALANAAMDAAAGDRPGSAVGKGQAGRPVADAPTPPALTPPAPASQAFPDSSLALTADREPVRSGGPESAAAPRAQAGEPTAPPPARVDEPTAGSARPRHWAPRAEQHTRLILVRHGETALSAQRRFSGRGDPVLTEQGQAQALAVAARLSALVDSGSKTRVVSSPLVRARRTGEEIAAVLGVPEVVVEDAFAECDFGAWEGLSFGEVRQRWPAELDAWLGSTAVPPPDGESIDSVAARVRPAVARLLAAYPAETIVLIGHVTTIKVVLRDALDGGVRFLHQLHLDPAGVSIVDTWPDGGISVRLVNDTSHLGALAT